MHSRCTRVSSAMAAAGRVGILARVLHDLILISKWPDTPAPTRAHAWNGESSTTTPWDREVDAPVLGHSAVTRRIMQYLGNSRGLPRPCQGRGQKSVAGRERWEFPGPSRSGALAGKSRTIGSPLARRARRPQVRHLRLPTEAGVATAPAVRRSSRRESRRPFFRSTVDGAMPAPAALPSGAGAEAGSAARHLDLEGNLHHVGKRRGRAAFLAKNNQPSARCTAKDATSAHRPRPAGLGEPMDATRVAGTAPHRANPLATEDARKGVWRVDPSRAATFARAAPRLDPGRNQPPPPLDVGDAPTRQCPLEVACQSFRAAQRRR